MAITKINNEIPMGLTEKTAEVYLEISRLNCIKGLFLCGGTAQSIQTGHRLSEDMDFELIGTRKDRPHLDFAKITDEISAHFPGARQEILGEDQMHMFINDGKVKLSFYRPENPVKYIHEGFRQNNIVCPSLQDLLGMKLYTINLRSKTRDFYDIYCLLENGGNLTEAISYASYLSKHEFKSKNMMAKLISPSLYPINDEFMAMKPRLTVTSEQICERMIKAINDENIKKKPKNIKTI